jgi:hypothetical protein
MMPAAEERYVYEVIADGVSAWQPGLSLVRMTLWSVLMGGKRWDFEFWRSNLLDFNGSDLSDGSTPPR